MNTNDVFNIYFTLIDEFKEKGWELVLSDSPEPFLTESVLINEDDEEIVVSIQDVDYPVDNKEIRALVLSIDGEEFSVFLKTKNNEYVYFDKEQAFPSENMYVYKGENNENS